MHRGLVPLFGVTNNIDDGPVWMRLVKCLQTPVHRWEETTQGFAFCARFVFARPWFVHVSGVSPNLEITAIMKYGTILLYVALNAFPNFDRFIRDRIIGPMMACIVPAQSALKEPLIGCPTTGTKISDDDELRVSFTREKPMSTSF